MGIISTAFQYISLTINFAVTHHRYDQLACIYFIYKFQDTFYIIIADLHHRPLCICFGAANCRLYSGFLYTIKKGEYLVIFLLRKGVVLMIVAMGTFKRHTQQSFA